MSKQILQYIGTDYWSRPVYTDNIGRLYKDVELGEADCPYLHTVVDDDFEGEPDCPINFEFEIVEANPIARDSKPLDEKAYKKLMELVDDDFEIVEDDSTIILKDGIGNGHVKGDILIFKKDRSAYDRLGYASNPPRIQVIWSYLCSEDFLERATY